MTTLALLPLFFFCLTDSGTNVCVSRRDPFYVTKTSPKRKVNRPRQKPVVLGVISVSDNKSVAAKKGALVRFGSKTELVHVGDSINGVEIVDIQKKSIIIKTADGVKSKWLI